MEIEGERRREREREEGEGIDGRGWWRVHSPKRERYL